jgi:hypothetical protein
MSKDTSRMFSDIYKLLDIQQAVIGDLLSLLALNTASPLNKAYLFDRLVGIETKLHSGEWGVIVTDPSHEIQDCEIIPLQQALNTAEDVEQVVIVGRGEKPTPLRADTLVARHFRRRNSKN